jgi:chaperone modulatory protein CbpM
MKYQIIKIHQGKLTEQEDLNLFQFCRLCDLPPERIMALVEEGILEPEGKSRREWRFAFDSIFRAQKVHRLQKDLELNLAGTALAIRLLDRIDQLETMLENRNR